MTKHNKFPRDMRAAHIERKAADEYAAMLNDLHGEGTHYVEIGTGTYRYWVRPTPWFKGGVR